MKKIIRISKFSEPAPVGLVNALTVAYRRRDKLYLANWELPPRAIVKHNSETQTVTIEFPLYEDEYLAIGDEAGEAIKSIVTG